MTRIIGVIVSWMFVVSCAARQEAPMSAPSGAYESEPAADMAAPEGADYGGEVAMTESVAMEDMAMDEDAEYDAPDASAAPPPPPAPVAMAKEAPAAAPPPEPMPEAEPAEEASISAANLGALGAGAGGGAAKKDMARARRSQPKPKPKPKPQPKLKPPDKPTTKYLSADDSNSAASPVIARKMISRGKYVQPHVVRTYEFLNYYSFDYPAPAKGDIGIVPQLRALPEEGEYSLQVAVRGPNRSLKDLSPFNIVMVLDVSGSMAGEPYQLAKQFLIGFAEKMRTGDTLSIVTVNREAKVILESHSVSSKTPALLDKTLAGAEVEDITNLEKGVVRAYELANKTYDAKKLNRVILLSDGADNAGTKAVEVISKYAEDSDRQGIYLAGVGFGEGFNDYLMDSFTDKGRGAYLFIDSEDEIKRALADELFVASFDLAAKDIRLKAVLPAHWMVKAFHGEQISSRKADVVPQYLSPNDQMIYHMTLYTDRKPAEAKKAKFEFEAEFKPLGAELQTKKVEASAADMLKSNKEIIKGDAIVAYAEMLKEIKYPLVQNEEKNLEAFEKAFAQVKEAQSALDDAELADILALLETYKRTVKFGVQTLANRDKNSDEIDAVLGLSPNTIEKVEVTGVNPKIAVKALTQLGNSTALQPQEGYKFLALSSGPVWNPSPSGAGQLGGGPQKDPKPVFLGKRKAPRDNRPCFDLHRVQLRLKAPKNARSFSFDFNFFSAEYPSYINQNFNDTFYATLEAKSTNQGKSTNISFDANNNSIEVDNNYFQQPFHPIPNTGTGFDRHGSTGWLRTSWPIRGGEEFTLTFTIHDEGDAIFDSLVVLDNFQWHDYPAVGTTDPLN